jgi:hypothetical protein
MSTSSAKAVFAIGLLGVLGGCGDLLGANFDDGHLKVDVPPSASAPSAPSQEAGTGPTNDAGGGVAPHVVMFGGGAITGSERILDNRFDETWTWDGTTWTPRMVTPHPSVRKVREIAPWVPLATAQVLDRALAMEREDRFQNVGEMQRAIRHAARTAGTVEPPPMTPSLAAFQSTPPAEALTRRVGFERSPSRRRAGLVVAVLGIAVLGALTALVANGASDRQRAHALVSSVAAPLPTPPSSLAFAAPVTAPSSLAVAAPVTAPSSLAVAAPVTRPAEPGVATTTPEVAAAPTTRVVARGASHTPAIGKPVKAALTPLSTPSVAVSPSPKPSDNDTNPLDLRR